MAVPALNCIFCILLLSTSSSTSGHVAEASCRSRSRRELLGATTVRDVFAPVTNPVTVPATNPASNPGVVTVPSTNPGFATNPNFPPLYPEPSTMPDPSMTTPAPFTNPVTAPITNPATTPTAVPGTSPVTNPVTYPYPPQGGAVPTTPVFPAPATTVPIGATPIFPAPATTVPTGAAPTTMAGAGTWCVAKAGVMEAALQAGLDYACGIGGADCSALQPMGSCYNPNTMQAHASYAFNSYFQRNPSPDSCDFGGAGMLVATNPSSGACMYQTSSGTGYTGTTGPVGMTPGFGSAGMTPGYSTGPTTGTGPAVGGGSGSTVLNTNNNPGGTSMYGPDNLTGFSGATSGTASLSFDWVLSLIWIFTIAYVKEKV
ncbi:hypothetical protein ACQ4PT_002394 [Festuca glaucescens]